MKTSTWLVAACLAASLPAHAQFKPIEIKDQELSELRGRYVMPGRIISFGVVMSSTWQNARGDSIGAVVLRCHLGGVGQGCAAGVRILVPGSEEPFQAGEEQVRILAGTG